MKYLWLMFLGLGGLQFLGSDPVQAAPRSVDRTIACDVLVVGGGLAGTATAYEALKSGRTVCLTEITDWLGGQISSQGTSALDERPTQRSRQFFSQGYLELRQRILNRYGTKTPGNCWVSQICFMPGDGHQILLKMLQEAANQGQGTLHWFPNTVIKSLEIEPAGTGEFIQAVRGIQHTPAPGAPPVNTFPLSQTLKDSYSEQDSALFEKTILRFIPPVSGKWMVVAATETGELLALADLPYRLGIDPRTVRNPSASEVSGDSYCPQGYTYTFAMEATATPMAPKMPTFYPQYAPYYSFEKSRFNLPLVFTYRRIKSVDPNAGDETINPGDISMQNWTWGNDYRPGTRLDNWIYTRDQLRETGQLVPGGWQGGLRVESLRGAEELAQGYFYWLMAGTTDSQLGPEAKKPYFRLRYLQGLDSPMGTRHGLSKYPYVREGRRLIARSAWGYPQGFQINEVDMSRQDFLEESFYPKSLTPGEYQDLEAALAGRQAIAVIQGEFEPGEVPRRTRSRIYSDSVGIGHYALDFHPCMVLSPPETPGNYEQPGERQGAAQTYPFQIPLRAMIPPRIDNLLITGKSIATTHISAAAYRVHSFEWSAGAAAGTTADFVLDRGLWPYQLTQNLPRPNPQLETLQKRLNAQGNPTAFPGTSIFNQDWQDWK